jgi:hypothetical protein
MDGGICTSKRKTTRNKTKDEEVDEGRSLCDAESESDRGRKSTKDDIKCEADILHYPEDCGGDPQAAGNKGVSDAVESQ